MEKWNTRLHLKTKKDAIQLESFQIRREIFRGDSLLPFFTYIALIPLIIELNKADCGYQVQRTERKINHLLYMDEDDLENETEIVKAISRVINMNCGIDKCAKVCLKKGRVQNKT